MAATGIVRARIDSGLKESASAVLAELGLSMSDAIRLLMVRVARDKALPFEIKIPNAETQAAMGELDEGRGHHFGSLEEAKAWMMSDLDDDD